MKKKVFRKKYNEVKDKTVSKEKIEESTKKIEKSKKGDK